MVIVIDIFFVKRKQWNLVSYVAQKASATVSNTDDVKKTKISRNVHKTLTYFAYTKSCNSNAVAGFWGRIFSLSEFWKSFSELGPYLASCHNGVKIFCNFTFWFSCVTLWSHENIYESLKHQVSTFLSVVQPYIEETQTFYLPK